MWLRITEDQHGSLYIYIYMCIYNKSFFKMWLRITADQHGNLQDTELQGQPSIAVSSGARR